MEKQTYSTIEKENPTPALDGFIENEVSDEINLPFEYKILKGHFEPDRETWQSDQELRMEYLRLTDRLIMEALKETEVLNPETGEIEMRRPSVMIFLDKSARPLSHLVRAMWPTFAKNYETGEVPPMPQFNFLNIDRDQWTNTTNEQGLGRVAVDLISPGIIRNLRATSLTPQGKHHVIAEGAVTTAVDALPATLDNESILVVDETRSTGRTLRIATSMIQRAFPKAHVNGTHWMSKTFRLKDGTELNGIPNWYSETEVTGRGVHDRYAAYTKYQRIGALTEENYHRSVGSLFLSAPPDERDEKYHQLIREFKELAANPDVPIIPSEYREDSDWINRVIAYNFKDVDPTLLTEDEKEPYVAEVIARKNAIHAASKEEGERMRIKNSPKKRQR